MLPPDLINQFANTFQEWHYLAVGLAVGFSVGFVVRAFLDAYTKL
jgi:uncharacterized membrane-anchored protein YhcB (DUF1043 family)